MEKNITLFVLLAFLNVTAQTKDNYEIKITASSNNNLRQINLVKVIKNQETFEGYFYSRKVFEPYLVAKINDGGFSFLDSEVYGNFADYLKEKWVDNNFVDIGLSELTQAPEFTKALSFNISILRNKKSADSVHLFIKCAEIALKDTNKIPSKETDLSLKLDYKYFSIPLNQDVNLAFLTQIFKDSDFKIRINSFKENERILDEDLNEALLNKLLISAKESKFKEQDYNFSVQFCRNIFYPMKDEVAKKYFASVECAEALKYNEIKNVPVKLANPVYFTSVDVPFCLYNESKMEKYSKYKTKEAILQAKYKILIVPISESVEGITADVFISYTKLQLNDGIKRWTPIMKRMTINYRDGVRIELPKENWTANFTRSGEQYDIFGYYDYEKFIDESIYISLIK